MRLVFACDLSSRYIFLWCEKKEKNPFLRAIGALKKKSFHQHWELNSGDSLSLSHHPAHTVSLLNFTLGTSSNPERVPSGTRQKFPSQHSSLMDKPLQGNLKDCQAHPNCQFCQHRKRPIKESLFYCHLHKLFVLFISYLPIKHTARHYKYRFPFSALLPICFSWPGNVLPVYAHRQLECQDFSTKVKNCVSLSRTVSPSPRSREDPSHPH